MLPKNKRDLQLLRFRETAKAGYPGGMARGKEQVVVAGNKKAVIDFFSKGEFKIPTLKNFDREHEKICTLLSNFLKINKKRRRNLIKKTVAAKFADTFLYQLMKFNEYRKLWKKLNLIIDNRAIQKLKIYKNKKLNDFLDNYSSRPYEAEYKDYKRLQRKIEEFIKPEKPPFIKSKIDLNFLWAID